MTNPRGSIYTMEISPKRPSPLWLWGPNSIIVVYMDPLGMKRLNKAGVCVSRTTCGRKNLPF